MQAQPCCVCSGASTSGRLALRSSPAPTPTGAWQPGARRRSAAWAVHAAAGAPLAQAAWQGFSHSLHARRELQLGSRSQSLLCSALCTSSKLPDCAGVAEGAPSTWKGHGSNCAAPLAHAPGASTRRPTGTRCSCLRAHGLLRQARRPRRSSCSARPAAGLVAAGMAAAAPTARPRRSLLMAARSGARWARRAATSATRSTTRPAWR